MGAFFGARFAEKRAFCLLVSPKQMPFLNHFYPINGPVKSTHIQGFSGLHFPLFRLHMDIYFVNFLLYYFDIFIFICGWHNICFFFFSHCFKILQIFIVFTFLSKISSSLLTLYGLGSTVSRLQNHYMKTVCIVRTPWVLGGGGDWAIFQNVHKGGT